ncbi:MAG: glycosyltransferase family 4 protein [Nitrospirales bacterium]|nr:glycosyltransferase family 4 protein [Nitrospira sp.]MDR4503125.1 glycosyltransferase family 4 protein [Nitrospirales bacterium]
MQPTMSDHRKLRVLLLVDSLYWATGNFARHVVTDNPRIEAIIASQYMVRQFLWRFGRFPLSFDVVHFLNTKTMEPFCGRVPVAVTLHHVDSSTHVRFLDDADAIMTVSGQWQHYVLDRGFPKEKVSVVPFAVDHQAFHPATRLERGDTRRMLKIPDDAVVIGFSGRRTSDNDGRKGMDCLVSGLKKMQKRCANLVALIVGPGWKALVRRLNQEQIHSVHIPYQLDHGSVARSYRALDVYWVTSRVEGGPVPLLEAMASGIPCLSTPVGAALDLVEHGQNGWIVPFDRPDLFVDRTLELIGNRALGQQIGQAARATVIQERSWEHTKERLSQLYERAIANFRGRRTNSVPCEFVQETSSWGLKPVSTELSGCFDEFGPNVKHWVKACEYVRGAKMLFRLDEWSWALKLLGRALKAAPSDANMWRQTSWMLAREGRKKIRRVIKGDTGLKKAKTVNLSNG